MKRVIVVLALCLLSRAGFAQEEVNIGPLEFFNEGAPNEDAAPRPEAAPSWAQTVTPALKLGLVMLAIGVPMAVVVAGRLWRAQPEHERALILLTWSTGRGRGFRGRVRSLAASGTTARRPISPIAMLLAPRAFDAALDNATHAERAFGVPLRHAVHGFRKA
jgi:hypothetical protein